MKLDNISAKEIRRCLDRHGIHGRIARHEHYMTAKDLKRRINFCEGYSTWSDEKWMNVLFSDETGAELGSHSQQWVQRPINTANQIKYMYTKELHPERINIWGCFSGTDLSKITFL